VERKQKLQLIKVQLFKPIIYQPNYNKKHDKASY